MFENPTLPENMNFGGNFNFSGIGFDIAPAPVLWIVFGIVLAVVIFSTLVLYYHWFRYGSRSPGVMFGALLYSVVTILSIVLILNSLNSYLT